MYLCRAVDEYAVPGVSFSVDKLFISIAKFIGIFFGSFVLGCAMGLLTALVSSHRQIVNKVFLHVFQVCVWMLLDFCP